MKLTGKQLKQFFTSSKGVLIEKDTMFVFIDCEHGKSNIIIKPRHEQVPDEPKKIIFSLVFDAVQTLEDDKEYYMSVLFNALVIDRVVDGKITTELVIAGERY